MESYVEDQDESRQPGQAAESLEAMLNQLRDRHDWNDRERDFHLGKIVGRFPADSLMEAVVPRFGDLSGPDAESLLRLLEANLTPSRLDALANALERQTDLPAERAWEALSILDEQDVLEFYPALQQRWDELNETLDESGSIEQLVDQIEDDPDGLWIALQGLNGVEPDVRPTIIDSLAESDRPAGAGLVEFLRLLIYVPDRSTREAALRALERISISSEAATLNDAWQDLATHHDSEAVKALARRRLDPLDGASTTTSIALLPKEPTILESSISSIDGDGRAAIALHSRVGAGHAVATFLCDVERGIVEVLGNLFDGDDKGRQGFVEFVEEDRRGRVGNAHPLAISLLAGSLLLNRESAPPSLRFWWEATVGNVVKPSPFRATFPDWEPSAERFEATSERVDDLLDACPDWIDRSPLTYKIAEEILLRESDPSPNPKRDAGAFRYLFEHGMKHDLESYRRRLLWMAWFWRADGRTELSRSALGLAWQLSDPQHSVPAHPFHAAIMTRSLAEAQRNLQSGWDSRSRNRHRI